MTPITRAWTLIELQRVEEELSALRAVVRRIRRQWSEPEPLVWSVLA